MSAAVAQAVSACLACDQDFIDPATLRLLGRLFQQAVKLIYNRVIVGHVSLFSCESRLSNMGQFRRY